MNTATNENSQDALQMLNEFDKDTLVRLLELAKKEKENEEKKQKLNPLFVQISKKSLPSFSFLAAENGLASGILMFLFDKMTKHNAVACSYTTLQEYFNTSRSSIYRAVKLLQDKKFIHIAKMGNVNVYHLNEELVWQVGKDARKYAEFSATLILSESEQERANQAKKAMKKLNVAMNPNKDEVVEKIIED